MKRLLSLLVAFAMILSMVPNAFAVEAGEDQLPSDMETIGSLDNPEVLADLGYYSVTLASGDVDGYYYAYTAVADGIVTANVETVTPVVFDDNETEIVAASTEEEEITAAVAVINTATEVSGNEVAVSAGDLVLIQVTASAAASVEWYGAFVYPEGSEQNPIWLEAGENILTIPAGATVYYQGRFGGMVMSAVGEGVSLEHNGTIYALTDEAVEFACMQAGMWSPSIFVLTNAGEADATCILTVNYPMGTMDNPAPLEMGDNIVAIEAGSQGYYFSWTAEAEGTLFILMPEEMGWIYTINNMTTYQYGDTQWSDSDPVVNPAEIAVAAGDELQIMVNTYDPADMWNAPAGELVVYAEFQATPGTESNPVIPEFTWNEAMTEATATVTVPANTTYHFASYDVSVGMLMSANGEAVEITYGNRWMRMPSTWVITNETDADVAYELVLYFPLGSVANPDTLVMGDNVAVIAGGEGSEYYYTWIAEADGTLTILMPEDAPWTYTLNNTTTGAYGDTQWSDSDPVMNPASVAVSAGDEIQLIVATYNADEPWAPPAGEVTVTASFKLALEITQQPVDSNSIVNGDAVFTVEVSDTKGVSYQWYLSKDNGATWAKSTYTGNKTKSLTVKVYESRVGWQVYCEITDANGNVLKSDVATITLKPADIKYISTTTSGAVAAGKSWVANVKAEATVTGGTIAYRWFSSDDNGATWVAVPETIPGYNGNRMTITAYASREGYLYRCRLTDADGAYIFSNPVKLTLKVNPLSVKTQATDAAVILNANATFTFEVNNAQDGAVSYKWFVSTDGGNTWSVPTAFSGVNTSTMTVKAYQSRDGYLFKCMASFDGHKLYSENVALTIKENPMSITEAPASVTVKAGEKATFHVAVEGNVGEVTYTWFTRKNSSASWSKISGETTDTLTVSATASKNGYQYFCQVKDSEGNVVKTATVTLTVK